MSKAGPSYNNDMFIAGGVDYEGLNKTLRLRVDGRMRRCVGIVVYDDLVLEADKTFQVIIEGMGVSTEVTILDDDGKHAASCRLLCILLLHSRLYYQIYRKLTPSHWQLCIVQSHIRKECH